MKKRRKVDSIMISRVLEEIIPSKTYCEYLRKNKRDGYEYFILYLLFTQLKDTPDFRKRLEIFKENVTDIKVVELLKDIDLLERKMLSENILIPQPFKQYDIVKYEEAYHNKSYMMYAVIQEVYDFDQMYTNLQDYVNEDYCNYIADDPRRYLTDSIIPVSPLFLEKIKMKDVPKYLRKNLKETIKTIKWKNKRKE